MRIYMSGTISNGEAAKFLPQELFFTSPDCNDDLTPSESCIMLSAHLSECSTEDTHWSCRWKGVDLVNEKDHGEDFSLEELKGMFLARNLKLDNMNAYVDYEDGEEVFVTVEHLKICAGGKEWVVNPDLLNDEISFC